MIDFLICVICHLINVYKPGKCNKLNLVELVNSFAFAPSKQQFDDHSVQQTVKYPYTPFTVDGTDSVLT